MGGAPIKRRFHLVVGLPDDPLANITLTQVVFGLWIVGTTGGTANVTHAAWLAEWLG